MPPYTETLKKNGCNANVQFDMTSTKTKMKKIKRESGKLPDSTRPSIIDVATSVTKTFLTLIDKHLPKDKKLSKILNRNTIKVSYSCVPNVKQTISTNNNYLLQLHRMKESTQNSKLCKCRQKISCPLDRICLTKCIVYIATVIETTSNNQETYHGLTKNEFKMRFKLNKSSFKLEHKRTSTTLSDHVWKFKIQKHRRQHQMGDRQKGEAIRTRWV